MFIHNAIPEIDFNEIDTNKEFFGKKLQIPLIIASMTGGHPETKEINKNLAIAVEELGIGMGVGSQRAAIENEDVVDTFTVVREYAPKAFIYANIGLPQILKYGIEYVERAVEMIDADAIAIHLNFLQEAIQPEGEVSAKGCFSALKEVCDDIKVPVIAKETGSGISEEVAKKLKQAGVDAIDVGGKGGTSWSGVEVYRAKDAITKRVGIDFWDWGIPTAFSIIDCYKILPTIATGGLRNGLDLAKSIALGAEVGSAALPFLKAAVKSSEKVKEKIEYFAKGLKVAMFLTGCEKVKNLREVQIFVKGEFKEWLKFRKVDIPNFLRCRQC